MGRVRGNYWRRLCGKTPAETAKMAIAETRIDAFLPTS